MLHKFVHQPRDELDRGNCLGIGHSRGPQHSDDADGVPNATVRRQHERDILHLERAVLVADEDLDAAALATLSTTIRDKPGSPRAAKWP